MLFIMRRKLRWKLCRESLGITRLRFPDATFNPAKMQSKMPRRAWAEHNNCASQKSVEIKEMMTGGKTLRIIQNSGAPRSYRCGECTRRTFGLGTPEPNPWASDQERLSGAPGEIRTPDLLLRRQSLYPAELRARS